MDPRPETSLHSPGSDTMTAQPPSTGAAQHRPATPHRSRGTLASVLALAGFIVVAQLAGLVGVPFTGREPGGWYDSLDLPPFNPPGWVFGPVWTALYVLIGLAAWRVWRERSGPARSVALTWWVLQLALNAAWAPLFFGAQAPWPAFIEIIVMWAAIVATIAAFARVDVPAAWMLAPYLGWVSFAAVLNGTIAWMN